MPCGEPWRQNRQGCIQDLRGDDAPFDESLMLQLSHLLRWDDRATHRSQFPPAPALRHALMEPSQAAQIRFRSRDAILIKIAHQYGGNSRRVQNWTVPPKCAGTGRVPRRSEFSSAFGILPATNFRWYSLHGQCRHPRVRLGFISLSVAL